jgi:hypothetical protein
MSGLGLGVRMRDKDGNSTVKVSVKMGPVLKVPGFSVEGSGMEIVLGAVDVAKIERLAGLGGHSHALGHGLLDKKLEVLEAADGVCGWVSHGQEDEVLVVLLLE